MSSHRPQAPPHENPLPAAQLAPPAQQSTPPPWGAMPAYIPPLPWDVPVELPPPQPSTGPARSLPVQSSPVQSLPAQSLPAPELDMPVQLTPQPWDVPPQPWGVPPQPRNVPAQLTPMPWDAPPRPRDVPAQISPPQPWDTRAPQAWNVSAPQAWDRPAPQAWDRPAPQIGDVPAPQPWNMPAPQMGDVPAPQTWDAPAPQAPTFPVMAPYLEDLYPGINWNTQVQAPGQGPAVLPATAQAPPYDSTLAMMPPPLSTMPPPPGIMPPPPPAIMPPPSTTMPPPPPGMAPEVGPWPCLSEGTVAPGYDPRLAMMPPQSATMPPPPPGMIPEIGPWPCPSERTPFDPTTLAIRPAPPPPPSAMRPEAGPWSGQSDGTLAPPTTPEEPFQYREYSLETELAEGVFSTIYKGWVAGVDAPVAIKFVPNEPDFLGSIKLEYDILQKLKNVAGFPYVHGIQSANECYNILILELLGLSLEDLLSICGGKFTLKTVLMLAEQLINMLEKLHDCGYIHRDIKPKHLLVGLKKRTQVHLIDYGMAIPFYRTAGSRSKGVAGTGEYCSLGAHYGHNYHRRDDMETLGYVLMKLAHGTLPWTNVRGKDETDRLRLIRDIKEKRPVEVCQGYEVVFEEYLGKARALGIDERPDYDLFRQMFRRFAGQKGIVYDDRFDWIVPSSNNGQESLPVGC